MRWTTGAVVGVIVLLVGCGETATGGEGPAAEPAPQGWRTETWRDTSVRVPADWAYGGAPMGSGRDRYACWAGAMVSAAGEDLAGGSEGPYVGRPVALTDVCQSYPFIGPDAEPPSAPYVWLGAAVEPGREDLGDGWVQETVEVDGSTVTVASDDPSLRERILASVTRGGTCIAEVALDRPLPGEVVGGGTAESSSLRVCVYRRQDESPRTAHLVYAAELGEQAADDYAAALAGAAAPRDQCPNLDVVEVEWLVLELLDADGATVARHVVHFVCPGIDVEGEDLRGFENVELSAELVRPWAVGGVSAVVMGPGGSADEAMYEYFIGPQG